jgi:uncharacterized protein YcfL
MKRILMVFCCLFLIISCSADDKIYPTTDKAIITNAKTVHNEPPPGFTM